MLNISQKLIMIKFIAPFLNKNIIRALPLTLKTIQICLFSSNQQQRQNAHTALEAQSVNHVHLHKSNKSTVPSKAKADSYESLSNLARRIQLQIFSTEHNPEFIKQYIDSSKPATNVKQFNPHLTNGGQQFEEFPLIKLISIALRNIEQNNIQVSSWRNLQLYIKKRLHRCTIDENMKLLYVMLKAFPKYTFDYGFIFSICLALKKQMNIMSSEQLKSMFYVLSTNRNEAKRYNHEILANLQSLILTKVLEKCEKKLQLQQNVKGTHLPIEYLYSWIMFGFTLSVRNNYDQLIFEDRAVELVKHFNERWQAAVLKQQANKITNEGQIANILYFTAIFNQLVRLCPTNSNHSSRKSTNFPEQFNKFKQNVITHTTKTVNKILTLAHSLQKIRTFRSLLQIYPFDIVQNLISLQTQDTQHIKFPKIIAIFSACMKQDETSTQITVQKLKILNNLYNKGVIAFEVFKSYYQSLSFSFNGLNSLDLINELVMSELLIFEKEQKLSPAQKTKEFILSFLETHSHTYRNFDWHTFHFVSQLLERSVSQSPSISSNLPEMLWKQDAHPEQFRLIKILRKIGEQIKFYDTSKLVNLEVEILKQKQSLKNIEKFFIEIRVNEMEKLKPILSPFNRLPHFSNQKEKIAVNSLTEEELQCAEYRLEKKLLNISGWRVINLNSAYFIELSLNQRLKFLSDNFKRQLRIVQGFKRSQVPLLERY